MNKYFRAFRAVIGLTSPRTWGKFIEIYEKTRFIQTFSVTWSQGGEDIALRSALKDITKGIYIDVGAHDPSRFSVTRLLYEDGWSGVNIDANKDLLAKFQKERTRDTNICCAIGESSSYEISIFEEPALSTIDPTYKEIFLSNNQKILRTETVEGRTLRSVLEEFFPDKQLDLLCIDAEGSDFSVLMSLEAETLSKSKYPKYLLLEAYPPVSRALKTPAVEYAMNLGYEPLMVLSMATLLQFPSD